MWNDKSLQEDFELSKLFLPGYNLNWIDQTGMAGSIVNTDQRHTKGFTTMIGMIVGWSEYRTTERIFHELLHCNLFIVHFKKTENFTERILMSRSSVIIQFWSYGSTNSSTGTTQLTRTKWKDRRIIFFFHGLYHSQLNAMCVLLGRCLAGVVRNVRLPYMTFLFRLSTFLLADFPAVFFIIVTVIFVMKSF